MYPRLSMRLAQYLLPLLLVSLTLSGVFGTRPARAASVVLYQNDFESPLVSLAPNCAKDLDGGSVNQHYGPEFKQQNTVETLLIHGPNHQYSDPSGTGGKYALGMLSTINDDKIALTFNSQGHSFINFQLDIAPIDLNGCGGPFGIATPVFKLSLVDSPGGAFSFGSGTVLDSTTITGSAPTGSYTFNWANRVAGLSTTGTTDGKVTLVIDLLQSGYAAVDNFVIVASDVSGVTDEDFDGVSDVNDTCPGTTVGLAVDATGCPTVAAIVGASDSPANGEYDQDDLTGMGLVNVVSSKLADYEVAIDQANPVPTSLVDLQAIIDLINMGVNTAPVITGPGTQITAFNTALTFSGSNTISISDADAGTADVSMHISATHGTLSLGNNASLGTDYTLSGPISTINTAIANLTFTPEHEYAGSDAGITVEVNDNGNTGSGGAQTASATIAITVAKGNQTITFADPGSRTYGDAPFALDATASSGLDVSYTVVSGPATVSNGLLTVTGAGDVTVRASQAGNTAYTAALDVEQTFTVGKAPLTITADDKTKYAGTVNPTLTASYNGFVNNDDETSLDTPVSLSTTATQTSDVGSYEITASGAADDNYAITFKSGTLEVTAKKVPTIGWNNPAAIMYGTPLGSTQLNATADVPGTFSYSPASGEILHAGNAQTLQVTFTPNDTDTYAQVTAQVQLDVNKAPLKVTIADADNVYGDPLPQFSASLSGFVNGDDQQSLDTPLVLDTPALGSSAVGSYTITGSAADSDYDITFVNGTLTVTPAPLTITADDKTKYVGTANPVLTASYDGLVNNDNESSLDTSVSLATTATPTSDVGTYAIVASGAADPNYTITFVKGTLGVTAKKVPTVGWNNPAVITYGTPLGSTQLNATADVPGTFSYTPTTGRVLHVGNAQTLEATFTPQDTDTYASVTEDVAIDVLPAPLTITIADASNVYGNPLPQFNASYSGFVNGDNESLLDTPLVFSTSATANSDVGSYAITGNAGDADYAITIVNGTLTVTQAPLTITATNKIKYVGTINPPLTALYSGFVNGDDENDLDTPVSLSTTATQTSLIGSYPITASGAADANYAITFVNGTLTVTAKKIPTLTWPNPTAVVYGTPLSSAQLNATAKDGAVTLPGTFSYSPAAGTVLHAGNAQTLEVTFTPQDTDTYAGITAQAQIDVQKVPLTITIASASKIYGVTLPQFKASYSGFVNGDNESLLDTPLVLSTVATAGSDAGSYAVTGSAASTDYAITFVNGTLTITPAPLTISANDKVRRIGNVNPVLTASYSGFMNGDNENDLDMPVSLSTTATQASPVGMYPITASSAVDVNYTITFENGTLTITDKNVPAIVWSNPAAITYGTPLSSAQLNAMAKDGAVTVPGTFSYTSVVGTMLHAGDAQTLEVVFTPQNTGTYASATAQIVIDVQKAPLAITADNKLMTAGGLLPTFTASYSGFVNDDTTSVLDTPVQLITAVTSSSLPGTYPIVASKAADADYAITFVNGTLTVSAKPTTLYRLMLPIIKK